MKFASLTSVLWITCTLLSAQKTVDTATYVSIGGIKQYIAIKGKDKSLPLLLFLHGGPGGSVMHYADRFTNRLQNHFLVVQWDQRETAKTLELNQSSPPLSLKLFQDDAYEMVVTLLRTFGREKLYLVGHSWGTALGFHIARNHPDLLYAYIPIGAMVNQLESERIALAWMKQKALKDHNQEAIGEMNEIRVPFENGAQLFWHRKWLLTMSGSPKMLSRDYVEAWADRWLNVFNEASKDNRMETTPAMGCPVYFFAGRTDYQTNSDLVEKYYQKLRAPKKAFYWFERSGHSIPTSEAELMQSLIIDKILPSTYSFVRPVRAVTRQ